MRIVTSIPITVLHTAGLAHTPNLMKFLAQMCMRPESNRATMIITVGYPHDTASAPEITKIKNGSKKL
jgi:iodotyrosine deiodinase